MRPSCTLVILRCQTQVTSTADIQVGDWVRIYALAASPARRMGRRLAGADNLVRPRPPPYTSANSSAVRMAAEPGYLPLTESLARQMAVAEEYHDDEVALDIGMAARPGTLDAVREGRGGARGKQARRNAAGALRTACAHAALLRPTSHSARSFCMEKTWSSAARVSSRPSSLLSAGQEERRSCVRARPYACQGKARGELPALGQASAALPTTRPLPPPTTDSFKGTDHIRFPSRVLRKGLDWIDLERPLPYDVRTAWNVSAGAGPSSRVGGEGRAGWGACGAGGVRPAPLPGQRSSQAQC